MTISLEESSQALAVLCAVCKGFKWSNRMELHLFSTPTNLEPKSLDWDVGINKSIIKNWACSYELEYFHHIHEDLSWQKNLASVFCLLVKSHKN